MFLAADKSRLQDLDDATRKFLAWQSILAEKDQLNLTPFQVKQAEQQQRIADTTVTAATRDLSMAPCTRASHAPVPHRVAYDQGPQAPNALALRACKKLKNEEFLILSFSPTRLRMELDRVPLMAWQ